MPIVLIATGVVIWFVVVVFGVFGAIIMWEDLKSRRQDLRLERCISESERKQKELNSLSARADGNVLNFRRHYLFTVLRGPEKATIARYCNKKGIEMSEFLANLAINDGASGPKTIYDQLLLALRPVPEKPRRPQAVEDMSKQKAIEAEGCKAWFAERLEEKYWLEEHPVKEWEAIFFPVSGEHYDMISRHVVRSELNVGYHGKLALAAIARERDAARTTGT